MSDNSVRIALAVTFGGFMLVAACLGHYDAEHGTKTHDAVFDERQMADQLFACKTALYTLLAYLCLWLGIESGILWNRPLWTPAFGLTLGICLALGVNSSIRILRDAVVPVRGKYSMEEILLPGLLLAFQLLARCWAGGMTLVEDGMISSKACFPLLGLSYTFLYGCVLWKKWKEKREKKAAAAAIE